MSLNITRRKILESVGTGTVAAMAPSEGQPDSPRVQLVEAGLRYEVPEGPAYDIVHTDSRPPYGILTSPKKVVIPPWVPGEFAEHLRNGPVINEQSASKGAKIGVFQPEAPTRTIPITLSGRKRPMDFLVTSDEVQHPTVTLELNSSGVIVSGDSIASAEISSNSRLERKLGSTEVTANTVETLDERVDAKHVAEHRRAKKVEQDTKPVTATPVLEVENHGELDVELPSR